MQELFGAIMAKQLIALALMQRRKDAKVLAAADYILGGREANVPIVWSKAKREWNPAGESFWLLAIVLQRTHRNRRA